MSGAHDPMALRREAEGDDGAAWEHHHGSIDLDPRFAMPHLSPGRLARESGDRDLAARSPGRARRADRDLPPGVDAPRRCRTSGAHDPMALRREAHGDDGAAWEHHHGSIDLARRFAMPHVSPGWLARKSGDRDLAARILGRAAGLLQAEAPARILLFGSGFPCGMPTRLGGAA